jgi:hypothetical protein
VGKQIRECIPLMAAGRLQSPITTNVEPGTCSWECVSPHFAAKPPLPESQFIHCSLPSPVKSAGLFSVTRVQIPPNEIWTHAFTKQISQAARDVLLGFYTLGEWVSIADLEPVFRSLHQHRATRYHQPIAPGDFRNALQEVDGAFLSYSSGYGSYLNPSIREFIAGIISGDRDTAEDLLNSAVRVKQVVNLWELSKAQPQSQISAVISENPAGVAKLISRLLRGPSIRWKKTRHGNLRGYPIDIGDESRIGFLADVAEDQQSGELLDLMRQASSELVAGWNHTVPDFTGVLRLLAELGKNAWVMGNGGRDIYRRLIQELLEHLTFATASDWIELVKLPKVALDWSAALQSILDKELKEYCENGVQDDRYNRNEPDEMSKLRDSLSSLVKRSGTTSAITSSDWMRISRRRRKNRSHSAKEEAFREMRRSRARTSLPMTTLGRCSIHWRAGNDRVTAE